MLLRQIQDAQPLKLSYNVGLNCWEEGLGTPAGCEQEGDGNVRFWDSEKAGNFSSSKGTTASQTKSTGRLRSSNIS